MAIMSPAAVVSAASAAIVVVRMAMLASVMAAFVPTVAMLRMAVLSMFETTTLSLVVPVIDVAAGNNAVLAVSLRGNAMRRAALVLQPRVAVCAVTELLCCSSLADRHTTGEGHTRNPIVHIKLPNNVESERILGAAN